MVKGEYPPLYCYMVSAKRYVLYNLIPDEQGHVKPIIRKKSDDGLGHLRSPLTKGQDKTKWVDDVWLYNICREHGLAFVKPDWFYKPAMAQLSVSKPSLYDVLNREKNKPYRGQFKPSNFMLVAYPENSDSLFEENTLIPEFYCREYKSIGLNGCQNKGKCKFAGSCFANLHKIPITPLADVQNVTHLPWIEKNTKGPLTIKVSESRSVRTKEESNFGDEIEKMYVLKDKERSITIKSYWDLIRTITFTQKVNMMMKMKTAVVSKVLEYSKELIS